MDNPGREAGEAAEAAEAARLRGYVQSLPTTERLVFLLRYADDLHPIDIGQVTGLPEHVVSGMLRRIDQQARSVIAGVLPSTLITG